MTPLDYATRYAAHGYHVFPCAIADGAKRPLVKAWQLAATRDPGKLAEWWTRWPSAMVGMAHRLSDTMALDVDRKPADGRDGYATLEAIFAERGGGWDDLGETPRFRTATGGGQAIYARPFWPEPYAARLADLAGNKPDAFGPGADLIFGYSVLPSGPATPGREWTAGYGPFADDGLGNHWPIGAPAWVMDAAHAWIGEELVQSEVAALELPPTIRGDKLAYVVRVIDDERAAVAGLPGGERQCGLHRAACRIGRALVRCDRQDLADWAAGQLETAAPWARARHERATIARGIEWGLRHGTA